jgi:hypothetical protein
MLAIVFHKGGFLVLSAGGLIPAGFSLFLCHESRPVINVPPLAFAAGF